MKLTDKTIRTLALPDGKTDAIFFDSELAGFGLRMLGSGVRTWVVQYAIGKRTRRMTLGTLAMLDPGKARETAKDILARVRLGEDPAADKDEARARSQETFGACVRIYLGRHRSALRPRSYVEVERHLTKNLEQLHSRPIDQVDRRAIAIELARFTEERGPVQANRTRASLHAFLKWCAGEGFIDVNPATFTNRNPEAPRERELSLDELAAVWRAMPDGGDYADIIRLLVLTGQRETEIGDLAWSEVDLERRTVTLPPARVKNRRKHVFPLSAAAAAILEARPRLEGRDFVFRSGRSRGGFVGWSYAKERLDTAVQLEKPWVIHDLRRSFSTRLGDLGIPPHIIEALINHQSGTKAGVSGTYNRSIYEREARQAVELWGDAVLAAVEGVESNVVTLQRA